MAKVAPGCHWNPCSGKVVDHTCDWCSHVSRTYESGIYPERWQEPQIRMHASPTVVTWMENSHQSSMNRFCSCLPTATTQVKWCCAVPVVRPLLILSFRCSLLRFTVERETQKTCLCFLYHSTFWCSFRCVVDLATYSLFALDITLLAYL